MLTLAGMWILAGFMLLVFIIVPNSVKAHLSEIQIFEAVIVYLVGIILIVVVKDKV